MTALAIMVVCGVCWSLWVATEAIAEAVHRAMRGRHE